MFLYIDESGSINNHDLRNNPYFVVAIIHTKDRKRLKTVYKRFVSKHMERLKELDQPQYRGKKLIKTGGAMFQDGKFRELKGTYFDPEMKREFLEFFTKDPCFEVFYIKIDNSALKDHFCQNTARVFNYPLRLALGYFIKYGYLPNEECCLQLDERNERTDSKHFLEQYLNTELIMNGSCKGPFNVDYFDSSNNIIIQIADVMANLLYSHLKNNCYEAELKMLQDKGVIKFIFEFPPNSKRSK